MMLNILRIKHAYLSSSRISAVLVMYTLFACVGFVCLSGIYVSNATENPGSYYNSGLFYTKWFCVQFTIFYTFFLYVFPFIIDKLSGALTDVNRLTLSLPVSKKVYVLAHFVELIAVSAVLVPLFSFLPVLIKGEWPALPGVMDIGTFRKCTLFLLIWIVNIVSALSMTAYFCTARKRYVISAFLGGILFCVLIPDSLIMLLAEHPLFVPALIAGTILLDIAGLWISLHRVHYKDI